MLIVDGVNGTFCGSQETIFKVNNTIREAISRIQQKEKIKKEEKKAYLKAFEFRKSIYGLSKDQEKYYNILKKRFYNLFKK